MMRTILICFLFATVIGLWSCNKVIELDLRDAETKYVIEGVITNEPGVCKVYISQSKNFNEDNQFLKKSGAVVKVKDNGVETTLSEIQPGLYATNVINGTPGHTYQLMVTINNMTFTASSTMPQPVTMDTLYVAPGPFGEFKFAYVGYTDPPGLANGYRFVQYVNGVKEPAIFWDDDEFTDGQAVITMLDASVDEKNDPRNIKTGDNVTVEMLTLDRAVYDFWYTLSTGGGDGNAEVAAPANPLTNIKGGALGYFSAHTVSRRSVIAP